MKTEVINNFEVIPIVEIYPEDSALAEQGRSLLDYTPRNISPLRGLEKYYGKYYRVSDLDRENIKILCDILIADYKDEPQSGIVVCGAFVFFQDHQYLFGFEGGFPTFSMTKGWFKAFNELIEKSKSQFFSGNDNGYDLSLEEGIVTVKTIFGDSVFHKFPFEKLGRELSKAWKEYELFRGILVSELEKRIGNEIPKQLLTHSF